MSVGGHIRHEAEVGRRAGSRKTGTILWPYLLVAPVIAALVLFIYLPIAQDVSVSFTDQSLLNPNSGNWVGLANYQDLVESSRFWTIGLQTVWWTVFSVAGSVLVGVGAAVLTWRLRGGSVLRSLLLIPWLLPPVVSAFIWQYMLENFGPIDGLLTTFHVLHKSVDFLNDSAATGGIANPLWMVILIGIWAGFPFILLAASAGLATIPTELYEAASLDGATAFQAFRSVTLPLLAPVLETSIILQLLFRFGGVDFPFLLTKGGPADATMVFGVLIYNKGFTEFSLGPAAAMGFLLFLLAFPVAFLYVRRARRQLAELV